MTHQYLDGDVSWHGYELGDVSWGLLALLGSIEDRIAHILMSVHLVSILVVIVSQMATAAILIPDIVIHVVSLSVVQWMLSIRLELKGLCVVVLGGCSWVLLERILKWLILVVDFIDVLYEVKQLVRIIHFTTIWFI